MYDFFPSISKKHALRFGKDVTVNAPTFPRERLTFAYLSAVS